MASQYRYDINTGVFVYSVEEDGAADRAGLKMGDVIRKVDDNSIETMEDLTVVKKQYAAGDTCTLTIYREGTETTVELTWDAVPEEQQTVVEAPAQQQPSAQYPSYRNPYDFFEYFFGNSFGY